jgi:hypothetical protein
LSSPLDPRESWSPSPVTEDPAVRGSLGKVLAKSDAYWKTLQLGSLGILTAAGAVLAAANLPVAAAIAVISVCLLALSADAYSQYNDPPEAGWRASPALGPVMSLSLPPGTPPAVTALAGNEQLVASYATALTTALDRAGGAEAAGAARAVAAQLTFARQLDEKLETLTAHESSLAAAAWAALKSSAAWAKVLNATTWQQALAGLYAHPMSPSAVAALRRLGFSASDLAMLRSALLATPPPAVPTPQQLVTEGPAAIGSMAALFKQFARYVDVLTPTLSLTQ